MSNYSNTFGGAAKDSTNATILGAEFDTQFTSVASMSATKADKVVGATTNNILTMDANGNMKDSAIAAGGVDSTEFAILDGATVTTAELNILDGVTATTAELNTMDGITSTTAELNTLDGVTGVTSTDINALPATNATVNGLVFKMPTLITYTSVGTTTWTKPAGLTGVKVVMFGGGGSGGTGTGAGPGFAGGDGAYATLDIPESSLGATETVTVGGGGAALFALNTVGNPGGTTSFGAHLTAGGGSGGGSLATGNTATDGVSSSSAISELVTFINTTTIDGSKGVGGLQSSPNSGAGEQGSVFVIEYY